MSEFNEKAIVDEIMGQNKPEASDDFDELEWAKCKGRWSGEKADQTFLDQCYEQFLEAVQMHAQHPEGFVKTVGATTLWDEKSTFDEWLAQCEKVLKDRLEEIDWKLRTGSKTMPGIIQVVDKGFEPAHPAIGESMKKEDYEAYNWMLRKSLEAIKNFRSGKVRLSEVSEKDVPHVEDLPGIDHLLGKKKVIITP